MTKSNSTGRMANRKHAGRHQVLASLVVAAAALGTSVVAHAQALGAGVTSWAVISNLQFTVVDLDLNDGITAAFSFVDLAGGDGGQTYALARATNPRINPMMDVNSTTDGGSLFMNTVTMSAERTGVVATTSVTSNGVQSFGLAHEMGTSYATTGRSATQFSGQPGLPASYPYSMWLTPHSELRVTAFAGTFAAVGTHCDAAFNGYCGSSFAEVAMYGRRIAGGIIASIEHSGFSSRAGLGNHMDYLPDHLPPGQAWSGRSGELSITFTNRSDVAESQHLTVGTVAVAQAIPEPSTYALMMAGLLGVAAVTRKRMSGSNGPKSAS